MIVREITNHPELLEDFDWFNDYKDTRRFLAEWHPGKIEDFDRRYTHWLAGYRASLVNAAARLREEARNTLGGQLLLRYGYPEPIDTPANLRMVAQLAAGEIKLLRQALSFYVSICGNTAHGVTRESAMEAYEQAQKALKATEPTPS